MLDDLVVIIKTIQERISKHEAFLSGHETRTRTALIDPLLTALGWNTADPQVVRPEYNIGSSANSGRVDYGLLGRGGQLVASIEAKRLGESLENHEKQLFDYAWNLKVKYAGLTDGNRWYFLDSSKVTSIDPLILELTLTGTSAHEVALQLLLLWHPNLASGQPVPANSPVLVESVESKPPEPTPIPQPVPDNWIPLTDVEARMKDKDPVAIRFLGEEQRAVRNRREVLIRSTEWLVQTGRLTADNLPNGSGWNFINTSPHTSSGRDFRSPREISGGLFLDVNWKRETLIKLAVKLYNRFGVNADSVELRFE